MDSLFHRLTCRSRFCLALTSSALFGILRIQRKTRSWLSLLSTHTFVIIHSSKPTVRKRLLKAVLMGMCRWRKEALPLGLPIQLLAQPQLLPLQPTHKTFARIYQLVYPKVLKTLLTKYAIILFQSVLVVSRRNFSTLQFRFNAISLYRYPILFSIGGHLHGRNPGCQCAATASRPAPEVHCLCKGEVSSQTVQYGLGPYCSYVQRAPERVIGTQTLLEEQLSKSYSVMNTF
jgi:hypothetical protein